MTANVVMYSTAICPYCQRAEALLKARGVGRNRKNQGRSATPRGAMK